MLSRINFYGDLNPSTEEESDKDLKEKALDIISQSRIVVSGKTQINKKTGQEEKNIDTDAKSAYGLIKLMLDRAGRKIPELEIVPAGEYIEGAINLDTSYETGGGVLKGINPNEEGKSRLKNLDQARTLVFDHHGSGAKNDTSATAMVYKTFTELGWLDRDPVLDKLVEFVTYEDNRNFPNEEKLYFNSYKMLLGLHRVMDFDKLYRFFKEGHTADEELSDQDLEKFDLKKESKQQEITIRRDGNRIQHLERLGSYINSRKYGKVLVDIPNTGEARKKYRPKTMTGFSAAKAHGYGGYIIYDPVGNGLFISTTKPITETFSQGRLARPTMWIKSQKEGELTVSLKEIVQKLGGINSLPEGKFKNLVIENYQG